MKKHFVSAISKLTLGILLVTGVAATSAHARGIDPAFRTGEVKFVGSTEDAVYFTVTYDNPTGARFSVLVLDEDGSQLFQQSYTDRKFEKRFKLPKTDNGKLTFVIRNFRDSDLRQNFEIDTRVVENVIVTKG
jgi:hypothetical protein